MKNTKRKTAFTIVELVIVIAVIGILAAVLIPTFTRVIKKAKQSNDIVTVKNMNTVLEVYSKDNTVNTVTDVVYALSLDGIKIDRPRQEGCSFVWDKVTNRILYVDSDYNVLNYEGYDPADSQGWLSIDFKESPLNNNSATYNSLFGN